MIRLVKATDLNWRESASSSISSMRNPRMPVSHALQGMLMPLPFRERLYQEAHRIPTTGYCGPRTRAALNATYSQLS
jgi:hypothetical protein